MPHSRRHAEPLVLVIHNIHEVHDKDAKDALDLLVANLPDHVQLAVSSRQPVWLTTPARRARREVLELGPSDLALGRDEVEHLLEITRGRTRDRTIWTTSCPRRRDGPPVCTCRCWLCAGAERGPPVRRSRSQPRPLRR